MKSAIINNFLHDNKWRGRKRSYVAVTTALLEGDIEEHRTELENTFVGLRNQNFGKNIDLWWESACIMHLNGGSIETNIARYTDVLYRLRNSGNRPPSVCVIAANLCLTDGSAQAVVDTHKIMKTAMVESGRKNCTDADIAACILQDGEGAMVKRVERFNEAFFALGEANWDRNTEFYPAAAVISLLPGSFEENLDWYQYIIDKTADLGLAYPRTTRAASIMLAVYDMELSTFPIVIPSSQDFN